MSFFKWSINNPKVQVNRFIPKGLKRQIFLGFVAMSIFFAISASFNIYLISKSKNTLYLLFETKEPSVEVLNQFKILVIKSRMLSTNWVYLRKDEVDKDELKKLIDKDFPLIKKELILQAQKWNDPQQTREVYNLLNDYESLVVSEKGIMSLLTVFESYDDPLLKFEAEDIVENKILPITDKLLHKLIFLIAQKNNEKNSARETMSVSYDTLATSMFFIPMLLVFIGFIISGVITNRISQPIIKVKEAISAVSRGEQPTNIDYKSNDEIGDMARSVNILLNSTRRTKSFAEEIGKGNFEAEFSPLSKNDLLGLTLLEMRDKLKKNQTEDLKRNWAKDGLVRINEILINRTLNEKNWFNEIISFVVYYTGAIQGGIYIINDENEDMKYLELMASYAFDSSHIDKSRLSYKDGNIGKCFQAKQMMVLKNTDKEGNTKNTILVPLKIHNTCYGVLEISSLIHFEKYQLDQVEKLAETITSTVSFIKINNRTKRLLDVSMEQRRLLQEQDEELRDKMSQLRTTQEQAIKAKEKAEDAVIAKSQFLSVMSHEIRTPMNAVIGMTNLLIESNPQPDQVETLNILKFSAQNLLSLINDILDFNKIDSGKITLEHIDFSLQDLIYNIRNTVKYRAVEKNIGLEVEIDPKLPKAFKGDPVRISQILNNLVSNAVKFTTNGFVKIKLDQEETFAEYATIRISIQDSGIGIEESKQSLIFENFTQASSDTTRKYGGTGLGLAITKKLLQLMDSEISVESVFGEGSTFTFKLHLAIGKVENIQEKQHINESIKNNLTGVHILLVEDNDTNIIVATKFLDKWKCTYDVVNNGELAVEKTKNNQYDLILMDIQMPVMDGYDATKLIRVFNPAIPIVALSAEAMADVKDYALSIGMTDFITKPFNIPELFDKIHRYTKALPDYPEQGINMITQSSPLAFVNFSKYDELADGDYEFMVQLLNQTILDFTDSKIKYLEAAHIQDESTMGKISHKITPSIKLFCLTEMENAIAAQRSIIKEGQYQIVSEQFDALSTEIEKMFEKVIEEVSVQINYIKKEHDIIS